MKAKLRLLNVDGTSLGENEAPAHLCLPDDCVFQLRIESYHMREDGSLAAMIVLPAELFDGSHLN